VTKTTIKNILAVLFCTLVSVSAGISFAQEKTIAQLQAELISPWLVTVEGEARTRTLRIAGAALKADGMLSLNASYGWTDEGQFAITASASLAGQQSTLQFVTGSSAEVLAKQAPDGSFEGTFTYKGAAKAVRIQKLSEDELQQKIAAAKAARAVAIVKPADDVPASCASFSGRWAGSWAQGGIGQQWLWVVSIDSKCVAKIAYLGSNRNPTGFETVEIKDGVLEWLCNRGTGGTCVLKRHGDDLWASYSNPAGGRNSAVFTKVR